MDYTEKAFEQLYKERYPKKMYGKSTRQKVWKLQGDLNRDFWNAIGMVNDQGVLVSRPKPYEQLELE